MKILVINTGSSSLKYQLIDMVNETVLAKGLCDRIGIEGSFLKQSKGDADAIVIEKRLPDHKVAIQQVIEALTDREIGVISDMSEISAVGHRVVHGGEKFYKSVLIDKDVIKAIEECIDLAPLHNPPNIVGIEACKQIMPNTPMVAVFDTAFHQSMPKKAYMYSIPYRLYEKYGIRKYGFHGTSHEYIARRAAEMLGKAFEEVKLITCHLGNGSSVCAIDKGYAVDTSMGFTPLDGLAMGTRSGSIDPAIVTFLMEKEGLSTTQVNTLINKESGVLGISGISSDFRDLDKAANEGNDRAELALQIFAYRVKKYIGKYAAAMDGIDAVVFTAGIGENNPGIRKRTIGNMSYLGISIDDTKNNSTIGVEQDISTPEARTRVFVIPTNEELAIARKTKKVLDDNNY